MKEYMNEDGYLHRVNDPALEWSDGEYSWWYKGEMHRYYGAAWIHFNYYEYWIFGKEII